ncbi:hypothetical protein CEXT_267531 [Caerostris extrusa]|uniref:Uncharacterized protein n=1 Tax=Caerostris extrusa TaxID=172846 RepID=A0AAV4QDZ8_CAEEX|nr:hypothetical protein CEXT_267531 [Caerostris extrusa]
MLRHFSQSIKRKQKNDFLLMNRKQALIPRRLTLIPIIRKEYLRTRKRGQPAMITSTLFRAPSRSRQQKRALSRSIGISPRCVGWIYGKNWADCRAPVARLRAPLQEQKGLGFFIVRWSHMAPYVSGNCFQFGRSNHCYLGSGNEISGQERNLHQSDTHITFCNVAKVHVL